MALVCGDLHGNFKKAKAFLDYKVEEEHIQVGDIFDSFIASNDDIINTARLIYESDCITLAGNHCNQYFAQAGNFTHCSGYRPHAAPLFMHILEQWKDRIVAAHIADDYIITHAGISEGFGKLFDSMDFMVATINSEFDKYKNAVVPQESYSPIFNISSARGGRDMFGGVFWADYRFEPYDIRFKQVVGHSHTKDPQIIQASPLQVCVDCDKFICFNTQTNEFESFFPEELESSREMLEVCF